MGYGTTWQMGHESDARLLWENRFPSSEQDIEVKLIMSVEMQMLRCLLQGLSAFDPKVQVYETAFPKQSDPEWEEWYQNIVEEFISPIEVVLPEFLAELRSIEPTEVASLGKQWGAMIDGWWHKEFPDHAAWALGEFIRVARIAGEQQKCVFAKMFL